MHRTPSLGTLTPSPPGLGRATPSRRGGLHNAGQWSARSPPRPTPRIHHGHCNTPRSSRPQVRWNVHVLCTSPPAQNDQTLRESEVQTNLHCRPLESNSMTDPHRARTVRRSGQDAKPQQTFPNLFTWRQILCSLRMPEPSHSPQTHISSASAQIKPIACQAPNPIATVQTSDRSVHCNPTPETLLPF